VDPASAIRFAAACEALHNATLVHDDLQDGDRKRRGADTVWRRFSPAQAINAGDGLFFVALALLDAAGSDSRIAGSVRSRYPLARERLVRDTLEVIHGQALELDLRRSMLSPRVHPEAEPNQSTNSSSALPAQPKDRADASPPSFLLDYTSVAESKTSALFRLPLAGAAVLVGLEGEVVHALSNAARLLGVMFQVQDDLLDLLGDKGRGEAGCDIKEGKPSLLALHALSNASQKDREWLRCALAAPRSRTRAGDVRKAVGIMVDTGSVRFCAEFMASRRGLVEEIDLGPYPALTALVRSLPDLLQNPRMRSATSSLITKMTRLNDTALVPPCSLGLGEKETR